MLSFSKCQLLKGTKTKNEYKEINYELSFVRFVELKRVSKEVLVDKNDTDYITKSYRFLSLDRDINIGDFILCDDVYYKVKSKKVMRLTSYVVEVYNYET